MFAINKSDFFNLGKILKFNRKNGELSVWFDVDDPSYYENIEMFFVEIDAGLVPFFIKNIRNKSDNIFLIRLKDYDTPEKAQPLVNHNVFLHKSSLQELDENRFYFHEIIGYSVIDQKLGKVGKVVKVLERPEQDILQIVFKDKEILIPLADEIFQKVNRRKKQIFINTPEGLIDLYLEEK